MLFRSLDGDEFAILAPRLAGETTLLAYGRRVVDAYREPFIIDGARIGVSVCVGAYVAHGPKIGFETVLRNAGLAVRMAQAHGAGSVHVFGPKDDAALLEKQALERDLRVALERGELRLVYQPMFGVETDSITGFEALLRWSHPTRGEVSPATFIPLAEETGAIEAIGAWVIQQACATAAHWPSSVKVCLNVSAQQLRQRVIASYHLGPMDAQETRAYIEHRLATVGWNGDPSFDDAAHAAIYAYSGGIPRKVNTLMEDRKSTRLNSSH